MPYKDSLPANEVIKKRMNAIRKILRFRRDVPRLSYIDTLDIMTEDYLKTLKNK